MKLGKLSDKAMDNLMCAVRHLDVPPEVVIQYILENKNVSIQEAMRHDIREKTEKTEGIQQ